jgi:hypothetical protein
MLSRLISSFVRLVCDDHFAHAKTIENHEVFGCGRLFNSARCYHFFTPYSKHNDYLAGVSLVRSLCDSEG